MQLTDARLKEIGAKRIRAKRIRAMHITDARLTTKGREAMGKALPACKISE